MSQIIRRHTMPIAIAAALACSITAAPVARADAGAGAIRLGADVPVFALNDFPDANPSLTLQAGPWGNAFGYLGPLPLVGASFGYQVTDAIVIGARAGFGIGVVHSQVDTPFGTVVNDTNVGAIGLLPYFEYLFLDGNIRPFVGAQAGFQVFWPDSGDGQGAFIGGGLGGVHIFATPSFSISPIAYLDFVYRGADRNAGVDFIIAVSFEGWMN